MTDHALAPDGAPRARSRRRILAAAAGAAVLAFAPAARAVVPVRPGDVVLGSRQAPVLRRVLARMGRVQSMVGHGNFALLGFDAMLRVSRNHASVGRFTVDEVAFLERLFEADARRYGFLGEKVFGRLTEEVDRPATVPVRATGQRLFRGAPRARFAAMRRTAGPTLVLTSGVRSVAKQIHLFLAKAASAGGNLSLASRSLAPPGYSFHGIGDFDVGERGLGSANFTEAFARTAVFQRLSGAGQLPMRYPRGNGLGVRYEPWHVRVV